MNALKELSGDIHQGNLTLPSQKVEFKRNEEKKKLGDLHILQGASIFVHHSPESSRLNGDLSLFALGLSPSAQSLSP